MPAGVVLLVSRGTAVGGPYRSNSPIDTASTLPLFDVTVSL